MHRFEERSIPNPHTAHDFGMRTSHELKSSDPAHLFHLTRRRTVSVAASGRSHRSIDHGLGFLKHGL
jgi:hypothetical protein